MIGYILLVLSILIICRNTSSVSISQKSILCFIVLFLFSALRSGLGYDYWEYFHSITYGDYERWEIIPTYIADISNNDPIVFFGIISAIILFLFIRPLAKKANNFDYSMLFFVLFPTFFIQSMGIVRQYIAFGLVFYAATIYKGNVIKQLLLIFLASISHTSGLVGVLILFPWQKLNKTVLWIMLISSIITGAALAQVISNIAILPDYIVSKADRYLNVLELEGGTKFIYVFYLLMSTILIKYDTIIKYSEDNKYYVALTCLGVTLLAIFQQNYHMASRLCIFFFSSILIYIYPLVNSYMRSRQVYIIVMLLWFVFQLWFTHTNGQGKRFEDTEHTSYVYPYRTIF